MGSEITFIIGRLVKLASANDQAKSNKRQQRKLGKNSPRDTATNHQISADRVTRWRNAISTIKERVCSERLILSVRGSIAMVKEIVTVYVRVRYLLNFIHRPIR